MNEVRVAAPLLRGKTVGVAAAAGLAAAMGVGRFVFTPLLPIMTASAEISAGDGALIATGNYAGYLVGALLLTRRPGLGTRPLFLAWSLLLVASEAAMATTTAVWIQIALRFLAGAASAAIFIACATTVAQHRAEGASPGVAFAGVGAGIAGTGIYTLLAAPHLSWQGLWIGSAVLTAALLVPAVLLDIRPETRAADTAGTGGSPAARRSSRLLLGSYFAEGVGYIIVGTFLVAAVSGTGSASAGALVWMIVGLAAAVSTVAWHAVAGRIGTGPALVTALLVQAAGTAAAAVSDSVAIAVVAAVAFGGTFMAVVVLTLDAARRLGIAHAAAMLTAAYATGQVIGPLLVVPLVDTSYTSAFALAAPIIALSAVLARAANPGPRVGPTPAAPRLVRPAHRCPGRTAGRRSECGP
ncbi:YbfB/YjiJ family MFS transporter [Nocardia carnea]|uniref:YbfB/YjiJ family MFS transporter n=1 Tax=Nocardia carnea TaxID=37328 RepID=UPI0024549E4D|nr:YbfB/YjiJ family MFS transporter [Nocardia carnea]